MAAQIQTPGPRNLVINSVIGNRVMYEYEREYDATSAPGIYLLPEFAFRKTCPSLLNNNASHHVRSRPYQLP